MTKDISKQLDRLISKVQETNTYYLMQDNQISSSSKIKIAVLISLLLIAGSMIFVSSILNHRSQSNLRLIARHQLVMLYSVSTVNVVADHSKTTNVKLGWPEFAIENDGVDNIVLLSQYCDKSYLPWKAISCNLTYQTIFNNGNASNRYSVTIKEGKNYNLFELHNAEAGATIGKSAK